jgi:putative N6-adenine-specific DNA methylase
MKPRKSALLKPDLPKPPTTANQRSCFAIVTPGFEPVVTAELRALGVESPTAEAGGVSFTATDRALFDANLWLRAATRIIVRVATFPGAISSRPGRA